MQIKSSLPVLNLSSPGIVSTRQPDAIVSHFTTTEGPSAKQKNAAIHFEGNLTNKFREWLTGLFDSEKKKDFDQLFEAVLKSNPEQYSSPELKQAMFSHYFIPKTFRGAPSLPSTSHSQEERINAFQWQCDMMLGSIAYKKQAKVLLNKCNEANPSFEQPFKAYSERYGGKPVDGIQRNIAYFINALEYKMPDSIVKEGKGHLTIKTTADGSISAQWLLPLEATATPPEIPLEGARGIYLEMPSPLRKTFMKVFLKELLSGNFSLPGYERVQSQSTETRSVFAWKSR